MHVSIFDRHGARILAGQTVIAYSGNCGTWAGWEIWLKERGFAFAGGIDETPPSKGERKSTLVAELRRVSPDPAGG